MKQKRIIGWLLISCFSFNNVYAASNDTLLTFQLLKRIQQLQMPYDGVFPKGNFPSYRVYAKNKDVQKADMNIFFTGLISFTLQRLQTNFTANQQKIAQGIIDQCNNVFLKYKNRKGRETYNFWPTDTPRIFPNGGWLNWFDKKQALPDDFDDTVIILMALQANRATASTIHGLMQSFANESSINNTFNDYRKIPAYSTWFGKKMPIDFDVSVLCNVLYFVNYYQLNYTKADTASLELIKLIIKNKQHINNAAYVSPHYGRSSIILYNLSRLMQLKSIPSLDSLRPQLIEETKQLLGESKSFMEQVLLQTSLIRWGIQPPKIFYNNNKTFYELIEEPDFYFFIGNIGSMLPDNFKKIGIKTKLAKFDYYCEGYNYLLVLEHHILQQELQSSINKN
jgi:hypothetical protein